MVVVREFRRADTVSAALLVKNTFQRFNRNEFIRKAAVKEYLNRYDTKKRPLEEIRENFRKTPIFYVAVAKNRLLGMIRGRPDRIVNLFVDGKEHKKGIGRLLINEFEAEAKRQKSREIKLRASLYAIQFYQRLGYKKSTGIRSLHGLKVCPMRKTLRS